MKINLIGILVTFGMGLAAEAHVLKHFDTPFINDSFVFNVKNTDVETLSTGELLQLPVKWWNTKALLLWGTADLEKTNVLLRPYGLVAADIGGKAMLGIEGNDYGGGTLGTFKGAFSLILVKNPGCTETDPAKCAPAVAFWHYYSSYKFNNRAKTEVWGVRTKFGIVETAYDGQHKGFRLKVDGEDTLELVFASKEINDMKYEKVPETVLGQVITGKNMVTGLRETSYPFSGQKLSAVPAARETMAFDASKGDVFNLIDNQNSMVKDLKKISFTPGFWDYAKEYSGIVPITKRSK